MTLLLGGKVSLKIQVISKIAEEKSEIKHLVKVAFLSNDEGMTEKEIHLFFLSDISIYLS